MDKFITRKIIDSDLFNCSNLSKFKSIIIYIIPDRGISQARLYLCEINNIKFVTKICLYNKTNPEIYTKISKKLMTPSDTEINILKIFKKRFIDTNITSCIADLIYYKICTGLSKITPAEKTCDNITDARNVTTNSPNLDIDRLLCHYYDAIDNNLAYDKCAFLVMDNYHMTLSKFLTSVTTPVSVAVFKTLLFQIVYTLYSINKVYPKFRHYDLHTSNVMIKIDFEYTNNVSNPKFLIYVVNGIDYFIPYFGMMPKIIDFGFSILPEEDIRSSMMSDPKFIFWRFKNDIITLLIHIHEQIYNYESYDLIERILYQLEPNRSYLQYNLKLIDKISDKLPSYNDMMFNTIWNEYKNHNINPSQIYHRYSSVDEK